ncbi:S-adenosyl-L-methionine-dependent methyltransferase [Microdochium trichocladiopsis]|uniref:S-adenosyl-L-methionine-dependent methyltransferase n=1 Tax=Microdochium trichocladiopsis TaxID=1682393 RepID=A0A9P8Y764_9PEZI|nr:S-adenosyl-L-methionine-dependent methyltransferase [Microdochium trichocladiopsis]KAH7033420.1 S-adenosyl-L-methionine-dependent methyltransferase [Microdochium trichocladiopsis]
MPRLPVSALRRAHRISPQLAALLPVCRDLSSARSELRWIREHVIATQHNSRGRDAQELAVARLCSQRGRGVPLQYLLGSQPFGPLNIQCRPGVLIPRPETEAWVYHLARLLNEPATAPTLNQSSQAVNVVDFCTGTGCIPLLLTSLLQHTYDNIKTYGFDISTQAVALANHNLHLNRNQLKDSTKSIRFVQHDIFSGGWQQHLNQERHGEVQIDILLSNPPYISTKGFKEDTERSVRKFEPKLALVPDTNLSSLFPLVVAEDIFYARLLQIARQARPKLALFEVGDLKQATRVVEMAIASQDWDHLEVWRDWPEMVPGPGEIDGLNVNGVQIPVRGSGNGRSVLLRKNLL